MSAEENKPKITPLGLCQAGQDTVQEITQKTHEMFQALKLTQLPNGTVTGTRNAQDRIMKLKDLLAKMDPLFKRLRVIYTECQKHTSDLEQYKGNLVPLMSNSGNGGSDKENPPKSAREQALESRKLELEISLRMKNDHLDSLTAQMQNLVWDLNSILSSTTT